MPKKTKTNPGRPKLSEERQKLVCRIPKDLWEKLQKEWLERKLQGEQITAPTGKLRVVDTGDVVAEALRDRYKRRR